MATNQQRDQLDVKTRVDEHEYFISVLRYSDPECENVLPQILRLSQVIFGTILRDEMAATGEGHHGSPEEWLRRLSMQGAHIVYILSRAKADASSSEKKTPEVVAFVFVHPRQHDESPLRDGIKESAHIWIAGVSPEVRKKGFLDMMVARLEEEIGNDIKEGTGIVRSSQMGDAYGMNGAVDGGRNTVMLTVCTTPSKFPIMWGWLQVRNWNVEREMKGKIMLSKVLKI